MDYIGWIFEGLEICTYRGLSTITNWDKEKQGIQLKGKCKQMPIKINLLKTIKRLHTSKIYTNTFTIYKISEFQIKFTQVNFHELSFEYPSELYYQK